MWDAIGFGHNDGYSGALAYRGLRNAVALARDVGDAALAKQCLAAAERHRVAMINDLWNPATGWLAGWRSRDGQLHDYAFVFINAMAACFDMFEPQQAREVLDRFEAKRKAVGHTDFHFGIAPQLESVPKNDLNGFCVARLRTHRRDGRDAFGILCNGALTPCWAYYYTRALSKFGFTQTADQICEQLLDGFERGVFEGLWNGTEAWIWDGFAGGYEGTLAHSYYPLLAMAQHRGWIQARDPEFWPG